jgi:hypothetical protein
MIGYLSWTAETPNASDGWHNAMEHEEQGAWKWG